jgi:hypothetical protein
LTAVAIWNSVYWATVEALFMKLGTILALATGASLLLSGSAFEAEAAKKTRRDQMTEAQKTALRKRAREWCTKNIKGLRSLERVEIKSTGRVVCWYR